MDNTFLARRVFAADRYAVEATGIAIQRVGSHEAQCLLVVEERHCNARGMAMGGALYTLADFAAAVAANSDDLEADELHWVTTDSAVHYLSPAPRGASLHAVCRAIKHGRTTALYQTIIESLDNEGRTHAVAVVETRMNRV